MARGLEVRWRTDGLQSLGDEGADLLIGTLFILVGLVDDDVVHDLFEVVFGVIAEFIAGDGVVILVVVFIVVIFVVVLIFFIVVVWFILTSLFSENSAWCLMA